MSNLYRKKPVVVEARQFAVEPGRLPMTVGVPLAKWCGGQFSVDFNGLVNPHISISTLEGVMIATPGDWVIKGVAGEFYPCKDEIFQATYEPA